MAQYPTAGCNYQLLESIIVIIFLVLPIQLPSSSLMWKSWNIPRSSCESVWFWSFVRMMVEVGTLAPCRKATLLIRKAQIVCFFIDLDLSSVSWLFFSMMKWLSWIKQLTMSRFHSLSLNETEWNVKYIALDPKNHNNKNNINLFLYLKISFQTFASYC